MMNLTPRATPAHWSSAYIGKPWALGAEGPDTFDCWGLVKCVQLEHYRRELPVLRVGSMDPGPGQTSVLLELMRHSGWHPLPDWTEMRGGDLLRMQSPMWPHIGTVVQIGGHCTVLHCLGWLDDDGRNFGAVERAEVRQLVSEAFGRFEAWRWG